MKFDETTKIKPSRNVEFLTVDFPRQHVDTYTCEKRFDVMSAPSHQHKRKAKLVSFYE